MALTQQDINVSVDWAINNLHGFVSYQGYPGECVSLIKQEFAHRSGKPAPPTGNGFGDGYLSRPGDLADYFNAPEAFDRNKDYPRGSYAVNVPTHHICIYLNRVGSNASVFEQNADGDGSPAHIFTRDGGRLTHIMTPKVVAPAPTPSGQRLYFDPIGQTATFYKVGGGTFAMKIQDASYNWNVLENQGNRVRVHSASAGGDCWVYLKYSNTGNTIPGRYVK